MAVRTLLSHVPDGANLNRFALEFLFLLFFFQIYELQSCDVGQKQAQEHPNEGVFTYVISTILILALRSSSITSIYTVGKWRAVVFDTGQI